MLAGLGHQTRRPVHHQHVSKEGDYLEGGGGGAGILQKRRRPHMYGEGEDPSSVCVCGGGVCGWLACLLPAAWVACVLAAWAPLRSAGVRTCVFVKLCAYLHDVWVAERTERRQLHGCPQGLLLLLTLAALKHHLMTGSQQWQQQRQQQRHEGWHKQQTAAAGPAQTQQ